MKLGDIAVAYVELLANTMRRLGHNPAPILQSYQLDSERIQSPLARISIPHFMRLGFSCIEAASLPSLGLEMGRQTFAPAAGLAGLLAQSAPTVQEACQALAKYELLASFNARGHSRFYLQEGQGVLEFYSISPYNEYNLFVVDSVLSGWWHLLSSLATSIELKAVQFEFSAPSYADEYRRFFPVEAKFAQSRNALVFSKSSLSLPVQSQCSSTYFALLNLADKELARVQHGLSVREQTERAISPLLNGQTPSLEQVARKLNTTVWSLRRRLQAEGLSFQGILNDTRKDLAISYVRETKLSLGEIAYLLGFGSAVAFQRAFKRWTGEAPGRYRELNKKF